MVSVALLGENESLAGGMVHLMTFISRNLSKLPPRSDLQYRDPCKPMFRFTLHSHCALSWVLLDCDTGPVKVTMEDMYNGNDVSMSIKRRVVCRSCKVFLRVRLLVKNMLCVLVGYFCDQCSAPVLNDCVFALDACFMSVSSRMCLMQKVYLLPLPLSTWCLASHEDCQHLLANDSRGEKLYAHVCNQRQFLCLEAA